MENSISYETMMDVAARESLAREIKEIHSLKKYTTACNVSDNHKKAINKIIKQKMHRNTLCSINAKFSKVSVIILIMIVSTFTPVLTAEAVKKSITETLLEWKDQVTRIFIYADDTLNLSLENIEIGYMTKGFKLSEDVKINSDEIRLIYSNENKDIITIKIFITNKQYLASIDNEYMNYYTIDLAGKKGIWAQRDNINIFIIESNNVVYKIEGYISLNELMEIYKNIKICN